MKSRLFQLTGIALFFLLFSHGLLGQVLIGTNSGTPDASAVLELRSDSLGLLIPRMSQSEYSSIPSPGLGLIVFCTDDSSLYVFNGNSWELSSRDNDLDPENELQDLGSSVNGTNRTITITGGGSTTFCVADNDNSSNNEIQGLSRVGTTVYLSNGGNVSIADNDNDPNNELQNLGSVVSGTNRTINITGGTGTTFSVADNDNSSTNELDSKWTQGTGVIFHNQYSVAIGTTTSSGYKLHVDGYLGVSQSAFKPGGGSWSVYSDRRLKTDIHPYDQGLKEVLRIKPVTFRYNELSGIPDLERKYVGVIAQEIQEIAPYMVEERPIYAADSLLQDSYLTFDPSALDFMLINAVQEQQEMIEMQNQRIEELEQTLEELRSLLLKTEVLNEDEALPRPD